MKSQLKIKVCGMKYTANRLAVEELPVDFLGFIFYNKSKRFAGKVPEKGLFQTSKTGVGVFVEEGLNEIMKLSETYAFSHVQLHGKEDPGMCSKLERQGLKVIKAFNLHDEFDFSETEAYDNQVSYFLFDTKSRKPGGSGQKFNWEILEKYRGDTSFFLSGGITPADATGIRKLEHPKLFGIDLNSGFEDEPGLKNIEKLKNFIIKIRNL